MKRATLRFCERARERVWATRCGGGVSTCTTRARHVRVGNGDERQPHRRKLLRRGRHVGDAVASRPGSPAAAAVLSAVLASVDAEDADGADGTEDEDASGAAAAAAVPQQDEAGYDRFLMDINLPVWRTIATLTLFVHSGAPLCWLAYELPARLARSRVRFPLPSVHMIMWWLYIRSEPNSTKLMQRGAVLRKQVRQHCLVCTVVASHLHLPPHRFATRSSSCHTTCQSRSPRCWTTRGRRWLPPRRPT